MKNINKNTAANWIGADYGISGNSAVSRKAGGMAYLIIKGLNLFLWCFHYSSETGGAV
jgi:hypothetical protein